MSDTNPAPTPDGWRAVDAYLTDALVAADPALEHARAAQDAAGLPAIEIVPLTGKLLHLLVRMIGARRVLEIGTLGGYSTIWLARAVGDQGRVTTIEAEPRNAAVARKSIDRAGVGGRVEIRQGRAAEILPQLEGPFDLVFIDADKESNTIYLDWAARLGRTGTVVVVDNVVRAGRIVDAANHESQVEGVRRSLKMLADDDRFDATAVQTLDAKGWDGFAVALITHPGDSSGGAGARRH
ncbi:O-methyltransferase [Microbacterium sp. CIAB417]|uniref:O-methyltransferase n=1 Tax=Microbacterium sp. CIAB417 TaxID=2860287 RepID=UPI001FAE72D6|nr:O-methyltransferase [Microbacterium sp. CIAB417]